MVIEVGQNSQFQWPPHRPRHCRLQFCRPQASCKQSFNGLLIGQGTAGLNGIEEAFWQACFNGLLIGQGTAGMMRPLELSFCWPGFNGLLIGQGTAGIQQCWRTRMCALVSMASSSAKALPAQAASDGIYVSVVSMASSSAKALPGRTRWFQGHRRHAFQWPPHRPRHCRHQFLLTVMTSICFNGLLIGQGTAGRRSAGASGGTRVSMASSSAKALPACGCRRLVAVIEVSMASSSAKALPEGSAAAKRWSDWVSMASSSAKALPGACSPSTRRW